MQAAHVSFLGNQFWVHPNAFLVHMPHNISSRVVKIRDGVLIKGQKVAVEPRKPRKQQHGSSRMLLGTENFWDAAKDHAMRDDRMFYQFLLKMQRQEYKALQDPAALACLNKLPWWGPSPVANWVTDRPTQPPADAEQFTFQ
jgi:hypothetical protein